MSTIFFSTPLTIASLPAFTGVNPSQVRVGGAYPHILKKSLKIFPAAIDQACPFRLRPAVISSCLAHAMALWFSTSSLVPTNRTVPLVSFNGVLTSCDPSTISRLVIFGVIDPSHHMPSWLGPHISKKGSKACSPRSVHSYAFSPVPWIFFAIRIVATLFDLGPADIFRSALSALFGALCRAMRDLVQIISLTAAALSHAVSQGQRFYLSFLAAHTLAKPQSTGLFLIHASMFKDFPAAEGLSSKINQSLAPHHPNLAYSL